MFSSGVLVILSQQVYLFLLFLAFWLFILNIRAIRSSRPYPFGWIVLEVDFDE
jgi:hypothetical protein